MNWFFPSWNGDVRIAEHPDDNKKTIITIISPTEEEKRVLRSLASIFSAKGWMKRKTVWNPRGNKDKQETVVDAPLVEIGKLMMAGLKPGLATLTAIKFQDGSVEAMGNGERGVLSQPAIGARVALEERFVARVRNAVRVSYHELRHSTKGTRDEIAILVDRH